MDTIKHVAMVTVFISLSYGSLIGGVNEEWVSRYNHPYNNWDKARAIAVDDSGNVIVTGYASLDCVTIKYDANGNELWIQTYDGPNQGTDTAYDLAVDVEGNVYVTGGSEGECVTIKYDPDGTELWVSHYDNPGDYGSVAFSIAVDDSGNSCITGLVGASLFTNDYITIMYDAEGNEMWVQTYDGPGNADDYSNAVAVDGEGNVVVTGASGGMYPSLYEYATIMYDQSGNELWVARYNGGSNPSDEAMDLALDGDGNVYVTGKSYGQYDDYATIKYDSVGNEIWVHRYNSGWSDDCAFAIAVDKTGNVYVTGESATSMGESDFDYATIKYDNDGNELWIARYNGVHDGMDSAYDICVDDAGNVFVTGRSWGGSADYDYTTVKYDRDGNERWVVKYNGSGDDDDEARGIAVDASGNVYITGESTGIGSYYDYATIKYSQGLVLVSSSPDSAEVNPGDTLLMSAVVTNPSSIDTTPLIQAALGAELPNGTIIPILRPYPEDGLIIRPGGEVSGSLDVIIPETTPAGFTCILRSVAVEHNTLNILDEDTTIVTVVGD